METYASMGHNQVSVWDTMARAVGRDGRGAWDVTGRAHGMRQAGHVGRVGRDGRLLRKWPPNGQWPLTTPWHYRPSRWRCSSSASCLPSSSRGPEAAWVEIYTKPVHVQVMLE